MERQIDESRATRVRIVQQIREELEAHARSMERAEGETVGSGETDSEEESDGGSDDEDSEDESEDDDLEENNE